MEQLSLIPVKKDEMSKDQTKMSGGNADVVNFLGSVARVVSDATRGVEGSSGANAITKNANKLANTH
jgi:hypothetical protein